MKALVQRVGSACVRVGAETVGRISRGYLVLLGVAGGDTEDFADRLAAKTAALRIFPDPEGKMNLSLKDIAGAALVISQFTLLADTRKGNRPSFGGAMEPARAEALYERYAQALAREGVPVERGRFGAHMQVELVNDGPVTLMLEVA